MEDGWGNIIYLIIAVVVGIYSSLKKKKKHVPKSPPDHKEVAEEPTLQSPKQESNFESAFKALLEQQTPEPYLQPKWEDEEVAAEKEEVLDSVQEQNPLETSIEHVTESQVTTFDTLKKFYQEEEEVEREEIDWYQAIVYKEILDRKYN